MNEITVKWYDRAEDIFLAYWSRLDPAVTLDELLDANAIVTGTGADGVDVDLPASDMLDGIKAQLVWGFSATKENTIHAWAAPHADPLMVMDMLGHEIGHLTGNPAADHLAEEFRADQFGSVAAQAYRMLMLQPVKGTVQ